MIIRPLKAVYIVSRWNQPTETFVRREVAAALAAGSSIEVVSLRAPALSDGIVDDSRLRVHVPTIGQVLSGLCREAQREPRALVTSLVRILRLGRPATWLSHVKAWAAAVAVADVLDPADIYLAHFAWVSSTVADVLGALSGRPFAIFAHAHAIFERRCQDRYLTDRLQRAAVVLVESETIATEVRAQHAVRPIVMQMGVPAEYVVDRPRDISTDDPVRVLTVGALREKKGHDLLIRAVAQMSGTTLTIVGDGPLESELWSLVRHYGAQDRIEFLGSQTGAQVCDEFDRATLFCLASRETAGGDRDGVPNVLIEAMARGVPVVSTAVSGIPDLLAQGRGTVVATEDHDALRGAMEWCVEDPSAALHGAQLALEHVGARYVVDKNWAKMEAVLRSAAS